MTPSAHNTAADTPTATSAASINSDTAADNNTTAADSTNSDIAADTPTATSINPKVAADADAAP